jgi:hypothetical protein
VISAHLRGAISIIGRSRKLGQRSTSKRTRCIVCLQRRDQRLLFAANGRRLALLPLWRQAIYKQRRALYTKIQVTKLCLKGRLAATWTNTSRAPQASERLCQTLLDRKQIIPKDTIFRDDIFEDTCQRLRGKNEARIFKACTPLIIPPAEAHVTLGANRNLDIAIESVNEGWNNANPITKPCPRLDYAIGFRRSAFSDDQLKKLQPFLEGPFILILFHGHILHALPVLYVRSEVLAERDLILRIDKTFTA